LGYEYNETELEDMIYEVCKDSDKSINFEKFMTIMNKRGKEGDMVEEYTEAFRVFDRDGNGTINRDEMRQILITLGDHVTQEEIENMLRDADINEDGQIEYKKFVRLMLFK
jgi:Ca2+-binding EF-hand superfamily protein